MDEAVPPGFGQRRPDDKNGPLKGLCAWPDRYKPDATKRDRTDYWGAIAISPSTGKYAASCEYMPFDLADRAAGSGATRPTPERLFSAGTAGAPWP